MATSYWIAHPRRIALISAFSPEGVGRVLEMARDWPAGVYEIRMHRHGSGPADGFDRAWGRAVKDGGGDVWIEPLEDRAWGEGE
jgi:hypothetical protein